MSPRPATLFTPKINQNKTNTVALMHHMAFIQNKRKRLSFEWYDITKSSQQTAIIIEY